jgi:hypothetical protein
MLQLWVKFAVQRPNEIAPMDIPDSFTFDDLARLLIEREQFDPASLRFTFSGKIIERGA